MEGARSRGGCTGRRWSQLARGGRRWPEGVVAVGAAERERVEGVAEALVRGRRRVHEF